MYQIKLTVSALIILILVFSFSHGKTKGKKVIYPKYSGVVEGFYGPPWSHQNRLSIIRFLGQIGMNYYIYAPKDDPYHREKWRDPYPADQLADLKELIDECNKNKVHFCFAISPGKDITYSSNSELQSLLHKLDTVYHLGARDFALFLDDVPNALLHAEDSAVFKSYADAHVKLVNDLYTALKKQDTRNFLVFCPTEYYLVTTTPYLEIIGTGVVQEVPLVWTGEGVTSVSINTDNLMKIRAIYRRKPFFWENYPVNDYARERLFLGPILNRTPTIGKYLSGYVSNPMNEAELSKIPIYTIADFLRDPEHYCPQASWQKAIYSIAGKKGYPYLKAFCEECRSSFLTPDDSNQTGLEIANYLEATQISAGLKDTGLAQMQSRNLRPSARQKLTTRFKLFTELPEKIKETVPNRELIKEMEPYLEKLSLYGQVGLTELELLSKDTIVPNDETWTKFTTQLRIVKKNKSSIADNVFNRFFQVGLNNGYQDLGIQLPKVNSTMPTFERNVPEQAVDGDTTTYYWTNRAPNPDDTITIDYGTTTSAKQIVLLQASADRAQDYFHQGLCEFSLDGITWFNQKSISKPEEIIPIDKPFRYVRLRTIAEQEYWILIQEIKLQ